MSSEPENIEFATTSDAQNNNEESTITLSEILEQQNEMEKEANAILGGSDEKRCTYAEGYIKRQALYACLTCNPESRTEAERRAGVCLACSNKCHDGHEMIELYTKRSFRCDCGTDKILAVRCKLDPMKPESNDKNKYNHNFSGTYCNCCKPYPDPEDTSDDEMIQCIICEDWYHCRHLGVKVPNINTFSEMICDGCMTNLSFLNSYYDLSVLPKQSGKQQKQDQTLNDSIDSNYSKSEENDEYSESALDTSDNTSIVECNDYMNDETVAKDKNNVDDKKQLENENEEDKDLSNEINQCIQDIIEINKIDKVDDDEQINTNDDLKLENTINGQHDHNITGNNSLHDEPPVKRQKIEINHCKRPKLCENKKFNGASFWPIDWRKDLCDCLDCRNLYTNLNVLYLLDLDDTVLAYEEKGLAKIRESDYDRGMRALNNLNHSSRCEVLHGYNRLKEKLKEFLQPFVVNQTTVTEDDINRFFKMMKDKTV